jgi:6-phosphogluconolactonase (cycloisomerase 2 family)
VEEAETPMNRREFKSENHKLKRFLARPEPTIFILLVVVSLVLASCSSFPGKLYTPPVQYTIGGMVSGLTGTGLVLRDNGGNDLSVGAGATSFTFKQTVASGGNFDVAVSSQPLNPAQTCVVTNGSGMVSNANITSVQVTCTTNAFNIGGTISGLTGTGLVLRDNGGNDLAVAAGATSFTFTTPIQSGGVYDVSVFTQPSNPTQACVVTNGTGVVASANVTNVQVTCTGGPGVFAYVSNQGNGSSGGSISGYSLSPDGTLVPLAGSPFTTLLHPFPLTADAQGRYLYVGDGISFAIYTYAINALTGALRQVGVPTVVASTPTAIVIHPSGAWLYAPSINANTVNGFSIDPVTGVLTALPGSPFPDTGSRPAVVTFDPSGQYAFVSNNGSLNISAFSVNPATGQLSPKGTPISAGHSPVQSKTDPPGAHLYVEDDANNVFYTYNIADDGTLSHFSPPTFPAPFSPQYPALSPSGNFLYVPSFLPQMGGPSSTVGVYSIDPATGALVEISGSPFVTELFAESIAIDPSGNFAYVPSEAVNFITGYSLNSVTGAMSPLPATFPGGGLSASIMIFVKTNQSCAVTSCATKFYTISGTISGLTGTGPVLQDNGGNALPVSAGATSFAFATPIASGVRYNVTVLSQPSSPAQTCTVGNGSGTVANANITNVQITCTP